MSFDEIRKQQDAEYAESLLLDKERERLKEVDDDDDEPEPELSIEELRAARLKALDANYEEMDSPKNTNIKNKDSIVYKCQQIVSLIKENSDIKQVKNPFSGRLINVYNQRGGNKKYTPLITKIIAKSNLS